MLAWIKGSREARIALAIFAGLLLYRLAIELFSTVNGWLQNSSSALETACIYGTVFSVGILPLVLWRFFRSRSAKL